MLLNLLVWPRLRIIQANLRRHVHTGLLLSVCAGCIFRLAELQSSHVAGGVIEPDIPLSPRSSQQDTLAEAIDDEIRRDSESLMESVVKVPQNFLNSTIACIPRLLSV